MPPKRREKTQVEESPKRASTRKRKQLDAELDEALQPGQHELKREDIVNGKSEKQSNKRDGNKKAKTDVVIDEPVRTDIAESLDNNTVKTDAKEKREESKTKSKSKVEEDEDLESEDEDKPAAKQRKRKTKEEKELEEMPLAARSTGTNMFVGAHVSIAKGVENAITNAVHIGGNALALFLQSQRKWENPDLKDENKEAFHKACSHHKIDASSHIVPHGSYLVNLAAKDPEQEKKSYNFFLNDLKRCEALGIKYYNFHPGATNKEPLSEAINKLAKNLNKALSETNTVVPILENMAGTESIIGSRFTDLRGVITQIKPEFQSRIGICIDTCHTFAAGYDLRTPEAYQRTMQELDDTVGLKYLKALHLNDSKGTFRSKKDLHQNIGLGFLGLRAFHSIMNDERLKNIPMILETPSEKPDPNNPKKTIDDKKVYANEIKLLESLMGMDPSSEKYQKLEADLAKQGQAERDKMIKWEEERDEKERVKQEKARKKLEKNEKGQSKISGMLKGTGKKGRKKSRSSSPSRSDLSNESD